MANVMQLMREAPLGELIESVGLAIARAQHAMDKSSIELLQQLASTNTQIGTVEHPQAVSLLALGFTPTFYALTEVTLEASFSMSTTSSQDARVSSELRVGTPISIACATVNAEYSNKYSFSAEGSSRIVAKFVSLPPPQELRDWIARTREPLPPRTPPQGQPSTSSPSTGEQ